MKMLKKKNNVIVISILCLVMLIFGFISKKIFSESYAYPTNWYNEYSYTIVASSIHLTKYNGSSADIVVPSSATINNTTYSVILDGSIFANNDSIQTITFENGITAANSIASLFENCTNLKSVNGFNTVNTNNVTNMSKLIANCSSLTNMSFRGVKTGNVTNMSNMFTGSGLTYLDMSTFDMQNVSTISGAFNVNSINTIVIGPNTDFKVANGDGGSFSRGMWRREEDNLEYPIVDVLYRSSSEDVSGTYVKTSKNIISDMIPDYSVDYQIITNYWNLIDYSINNADFVVSSSKVDITNLNNHRVAQYTVNNPVELLFGDQVVDVFGNTYNLKIVIDQIVFEGLDKNTNDTIKLLQYTGGFGLNSSTAKEDIQISMYVLNKDGTPANGSYVFSAYDLDGNKFSSTAVPEKIKLISGYDNSTIKMYSHTSLAIDNDWIKGTIGDTCSELSEFSVKVSGTKFTYRWSAKNLGTQVMSYYQSAMVNIEKVDDNGNRVSGAHLELYSNSNDSETMAEWDTTDSTKTFLLLPGEYYIKETGTPNGYVASERKDFYVDSLGKIVVREYTSDTGENFNLQDTIVSIISIVNNREIESYTVNYLEDGTNAVLSSPKTVNNQAYHTEITETAIDITGYNQLNPTSKTITIETGENVINFYYSKKNNLSYVVNYYEENTTNKVHDSKTVNNQTFGASITENALDITGFTKIDPTEKTITLAMEENVINFYYRRRTDVSYIVNYYEQGTENKVHDSKIVNNQTFGASITENALDITGFTKIDPTEKTITLAMEGNIINFYYTRNSYSYTIHHVEKDNPSHEFDTTTGSALYNAEVNVEVLNFNGYVYDSKDKDIIVIDTSSNTATVYYRPVSGLSYVVNYYKEGTEIKVHESKSVGNQVFNALIVENAEDVSGYTKLSPTTISINISNDSLANVINFYYRANTYDYTIKYVEKNNETNVLDTVRGSASFKEEVTVPSKSFLGYNYVSQDKNKITIGISNNTATVYYQRQVGKVIVRHLDKGNNNSKIIENEELNGFVNTNYETLPNSEILAQYELINVNGNETGTYTVDDIEVIYYYQKKFYVRTFVNGLGGTITGDEEVMEGDSSTPDKIKIIASVGYKIKKILINDVPIEITNENEMVLTNFEDMHENKNIGVEFELRQYTITVKYLDEVTNDKLNEDIKIIKHYQDEYETKQKEFDDYQFISVSGKEKDVVLSDREIIYYYHKLGKVIVNHIDKLTNINLEEIHETGLVGDEYHAHAKDFKSYVLDTKPTVETKEIIDGTITFNYYYIKISTGLVEKHVDEYQEILLDEKHHSGNVGDSYEISSKNFQGYILDTQKLPTNSKGILKEELTEVVYYYKRQGIVRVRYVDDVSREELSDDDIIHKFYGESYETSAKIIQGYKLVSEDDYSKDILEEDEKEIIYYYRKLFNVITRVDGDGGTITGDEEVMEGYDSTKNNIKIKASESYHIAKITINGKEIGNSKGLELTLNNFQDMHEDKEIIVSFEQIINVPKTSKISILPYISLIICGFGITFIIYSLKKNMKKVLMPIE